MPTATSRSATCYPGCAARRPDALLPLQAQGVRARTRQGAIVAAGFAALSFLAGLFGVLDVAGFREGWGVIGAGVGALSGAAAGYAGLYAFERLPSCTATPSAGCSRSRRSRSQT